MKVQSSANEDWTRRETKRYEYILIFDKLLKNIEHREYLYQIHQ